MQEPQSLGHHFIGKEINASGVAARPGEVGDKTKLNRVFTDTEDDRDASCRSFGCKRGCGANRAITATCRRTKSAISAGRRSY